MSIMSGSVAAQALSIFRAIKLMYVLLYLTSCKPGYLTKAAKNIVMTLVIMGGSFFSYAAMASCTVSGSISRLLTNAPTWNIQVDGSAPINTFLYHLYLSSSAPDTSATCIGGPLEVTVNSDFPVIGSLNGNYIYDTGIPGIGMGIHFANAYSSGNSQVVGNLWDVEAPLQVEQFMDPAARSAIEAQREQADARREAANKRLEQAEQKHSVARANTATAR